MKKLSQGRKIIAVLLRRGCTYMEMLSLGISVAPWLRVQECLLPNERLVKGKRGDLVTWRVVRKA